MTTEDFFSMKDSIFFVKGVGALVTYVECRQNIKVPVTTRFGTILGCKKVQLRAYPLFGWWRKKNFSKRKTKLLCSPCWETFWTIRISSSIIRSNIPSFVFLSETKLWAREFNYQFYFLILLNVLWLKSRGVVVDWFCFGPRILMLNLFCIFVCILKLISLIMMGVLFGDLWESMNVLLHQNVGKLGIGLPIHLS